MSADLFDPLYIRMCGMKNLINDFFRFHPFTQLKRIIVVLLDGKTA